MDIANHLSYLAEAVIPLGICSHGCIRCPVAHLFPGERAEWMLVNTPLHRVPCQTLMLLLLVRAPHSWLGGGSCGLEARGNLGVASGEIIPISSKLCFFFSFTSRKTHQQVEYWPELVLFGEVKNSFPHRILFSTPITYTFPVPNFLCGEFIYCSDSCPKAPCDSVIARNVSKQWRNSDPMLWASDSTRCIVYNEGSLICYLQILVESSCFHLFSLFLDSRRQKAKIYLNEWQDRWELSCLVG